MDFRIVKKTIDQTEQETTYAYIPECRVAESYNWVNVVTLLWDYTNYKYPTWYPNVFHAQSAIDTYKKQIELQKIPVEIIDVE